MPEAENYQYTVLMVFPGFGADRESAEDGIQMALDHLNIPVYEPGWRFAPNVTAQLEVVTNTEEAYEKLEAYDDLAMMLLHDLDDEEKEELTRACMAKGVPVCHTVESGPAPRKNRREKKEWTFSLKKKEEGELHAHRISVSALTGSQDGEEAELEDRMHQIIPVLALSVMEFHFAHHGRRFRPPELG